MRMRAIPFVIASLTVTAAWGQQTGAIQDPKANTLPAADSKFMMDAATDGLAEVELGRLAAQKAAAQDIKDFARKLVDDHGQANAELKQLAARKNVTLPGELTPEQKDDQERLAKLSGPEFDEAYAKHMVKDHEDAVSLFNRQAERGTDPEAKAWAIKTLPTLKEHLNKARELAGHKATAPGSGKK